MHEATALGQGKSGSEDWISDHEAFLLAYSGRLQQARRMSARAAELAQQAGQREEAALFETGAALREAFFGNALAARKGATTALELSKDREAEYGAAFALALSGDTSRSEALANDLERPSRKTRQFGSVTCQHFALFSRYTMARLQRLSSCYKSPFPGSWSAIRLARWRAGNSAGPMLCRGTELRQNPPIRISSRSGKTPIPKSPF